MSNLCESLEKTGSDKPEAAKNQKETVSFCSDTATKTGKKQLQNGRQLARRKAIYLQLYPETRAGVAGGKSGGNGREKVASDTMSFATDTATKTGKSKRTTERQVSIGETLPTELDDDLEQAGIAELKRAPGCPFEHQSTVKAVSV